MVVPVHAMKAYVVCEGIAALILKHGAQCTWMANQTPRPLYTQGKYFRYSFIRGLSGPQYWSRHFGGWKNSCPVRIWTSGPPPSSVVKLYAPDIPNPITVEAVSCALKFDNEKAQTDSQTLAGRKICTSVCSLRIQGSNREEAVTQVMLLSGTY